MKTVLLTGFEPFGGDPVNPSAEIAQQLDGALVAGHTVVGAVLPCVFGSASDELMGLLWQHHPTLVICVGLAAGRAGITLERIATNLADARIPDNAGRQPVDQPVVPGGPAAYWSTLPVKAIVQGLRTVGIPAEVSQTAGTFVCNHVFYGLMHQLDRARLDIRGGFIHVPWPGASTAAGPGLSQEQMIVAIRLAIETSLRVGKDGSHFSAMR